LSEASSAGYLNVAAGAVLSADGQKILLARRRADQHQGNLWEFPGGKLESAESAAQALCRELREEINIKVQDFSPLLVIEHQYVDKAVRLHVFVVKSFAGEPRSLEGQKLCWVLRSELPNYAFPEANVPIVDALLGI